MWRSVRQTWHRWQRPWPLLGWSVPPWLGWMMWSASVEGLVQGRGPWSGQPVHRQKGSRSSMWRAVAGGNPGEVLPVQAISPPSTAKSRTPEGCGSVCGPRVGPSQSREYRTDFASTQRPHAASRPLDFLRRCQRTRRPVSLPESSRMTIRLLSSTRSVRPFAPQMR